MGLVFFSAAFPEIHSTSEFLEGKQHEHRHESSGELGGREGGGSVHSHAHRHGLYRDDVGVGK